MPSPSRRQKILAARELKYKIEQILLRGESNQARIAAALGVHKSTVCRHEKQIRARWHARNTCKLDELRAERLSQLDLILSTSLDGFQRSKAGTSETITIPRSTICRACRAKADSQGCSECNGTGQVLKNYMSTKAKTGVGDSGLLRVALETLKEMSKLQGLHVDRHEVDLNVRSLTLAMQDADDELLKSVVEGALELRRQALAKLNNS